MLRRQLQEVTAAKWTDATLNLYLNLGLQFVQRRIMAINPEFVIYTDYTNVVSAQASYPKPIGTKFECNLYYKSSSTATSYTKLSRIPYLDIAEFLHANVSPVNLESAYAIKGRFIVIWPTPTSNVTDGLKLEYVPTLSMGADADVPYDIVTDLHEAIVYRAGMIALRDTDEPGDLFSIELKAALEDLPVYYRVSAKPARIEMDVDHYEWED
jgi:hypothetical protein